jgi:hypothetical protein
VRGPLKRTIALVAILAACSTQDAGGDILTFHAYASGVPDAQLAMEFDTSAGFHVVLTTARMHVGAIYMRLGQVGAGSALSSCFGETTYGLEVPGPTDVDVLDPRPHEFSVLGQATSDLCQSGEVWLTGGDINDVWDKTPIVVVSGTASKQGSVIPFEGTITIGANRLVAPSNPAAPGANPICKQRIVTPIPLQLAPAPGGNLLLRIDPRPWFADLDFAALELGPDGLTSHIPDVSSGTGANAAAGRTFFLAVTAASTTSFQFEWLTP